MRPEPNVRVASATDAECIAALAIQVWLDTYASEGIRKTIAHYVLSEFTTEAFTRAIANPSSRLLVAEVQDHLVGYTVVNLNTPCPAPGGSSVELATLYVQRHFSGIGIGSSLLSSGRSIAREVTGNASLWLTVNARNERAISFYKRHGFAQVGTTHFEFGNERHLNHVLLSPDA
jgi:ribosomal protein S18 acetylase RimI-like enzyme